MKNTNSNEYNQGQPFVNILVVSITLYRCICWWRKKSKFSNIYNLSVTLTNLKPQCEIKLDYDWIKTKKEYMNSYKPF